jgi:hypothetical protein
MKEMGEFEISQVEMTEIGTAARPRIHGLGFDAEKRDTLREFGSMFVVRKPKSERFRAYKTAIIEVLKANLPGIPISGRAVCVNNRIPEVSKKAFDIKSIRGCEFFNSLRELRTRIKNSSDNTTKVFGFRSSAVRLLIRF